MKIIYKEETNPGIIGKIYLNGKPIGKSLQMKNEQEFEIKEGDVLAIRQKGIPFIVRFFINFALLFFAFFGLDPLGFKEVRFVKHPLSLLVFSIKKSPPENFYLQIEYKNQPVPYEIFGNADHIEILQNKLLGKSNKE